MARDTMLWLDAATQRHHHLAAPSDVAAMSRRMWELGYKFIYHVHPNVGCTFSILAPMSCATVRVETFNHNVYKYITVMQYHHLMWNMIRASSCTQHIHPSRHTLAHDCEAYARYRRRDELLTPR